MPILKHAKKKLKQDKKRTALNKKVKNTYKELVKAAKLEKTEKAVSAAFSSLDKAAKKHIIHANKAARLKSSITKILTVATPAKAEPTAKKTAPKTAPKAKAKGTKSAKSSTK
jgi:small subunit ribosomal protein S20